MSQKRINKLAFNLHTCRYIFWGWDRGGERSYRMNTVQYTGELAPASADVTTPPLKADLAIRVVFHEDRARVSLIGLPVTDTTSTASSKSHQLNSAQLSLQKLFHYPFHAKPVHGDIYVVYA